MNILYDIHTYLIISFICMLVALGKTAFKRIGSALNRNLDDLSHEINLLEQRKQEAEDLVERLKKELAEAGAGVVKAMIAAEADAAKIIKKASDEIDEIVRTKQVEYDLAVSKIRAGLSAELYNKIVDMTVKHVVQKLKENDGNRKMHDNVVSISSSMIETMLPLAGEIRLS